ncbi:EAL domain-containing protein [Pelosinus sp. sgz500959]|uniref:EAL domain-containing protein n=1 Tax=Pelosinus sp. sgz500959 TaxID=3242472 RepID=UPI0036731115
MHDTKDEHEKVMESLVPAAFTYIAEQVHDAILVFDVRGKVMYANQAASNVYGHSADEFQSLCAHDLYSPKEQYRISEQMKTAQQEVTLHNVVHLRRDGMDFPVEISFCKAVFGEMEMLVSIVQPLDGEKKEILITTNEKKYQSLHEELLAAYEELTASEEELRQQFDELLAKEEKIYHQNAVLNLLHDTAISLMTDFDHNDVFKKIIDSIRELFDAPNSFVHFVNEETKTYTVKIGTGLFDKFVETGDIREGIIGQAYRTGKIAVVENYSTWQHRLSNPIFDELYYFILVPLKNKDKMIGAIGLAFSEIGRILTEDELSLLQRFADLAALALSNTLLVTSLQNEIEERKQAEKEVRQSEERFSKAFQMSPSANAIARMDGTYVDVNESFCRSTGYSKEELISRTREQVGLWADMQDLDFLLNELKKHREVNNLESWFCCKDGRKICGLMSARVVTINGEQCIISITHDITKLKKIEEKLKLSEEKFSQAFYLSPDIITISRMNGTYVDVNEGFVRVSGFSKEEAIGKRPTDLGLWQNQWMRDHIVEAQKKHREIRNMEVPFRCKDGHIVYGQLSASMLNFDGEPCYMVVVRDITLQVQVEKERHQQKEILLANRNKLSLAVGLAKLGPWEYNLETGLYEFSDEFYTVYGTDVAREGRFMSLDTYIREFVHPEDVLIFEKEKKLLSSSGEFNFCDIGHRIIRRDGEIRNILVRRSIFKDADGKIIKKYGMNQDITELVRVEEERRKQAETIKHMAYFDLLTGLANRYHLNEWLNGEMERARAGKTSGVILFIDLDDLKMVNDTYGHSCGDQIISAAGDRIVDGVGEKAFVARIGGDEFVVILSGTYDRGQIEEIARKINKSLGKKQEFFGRLFHMTASIGIASYPADGDTVEEIIKNADNAMYAAKKDSKNCWRFYTREMQTEAYKKIQLTASLRYALTWGELSLVYQPQVVTAERTVIGFEALLRWNSSEYGAVPPIQFIPLAEQSGLIHGIGQWVLYQACQFARRLADQGWGRIHVAVNISSKQIAADDFISVVRSAVNTAGIQPEQLELEITESLLMTSIEDATSKLVELKEFGVHLSLDDFGTGFSSLTYLRRLPVETLKIDKSFIDMITTDAQGAKIIGSIINMAHTINMNVVAEGVETPEQLEYLADNGCDLIQGYLFSRPLPESEAIKLLSDKGGINCFKQNENTEILSL